MIITDAGLVDQRRIDGVGCVQLAASAIVLIKVLHEAPSRPRSSSSIPGIIAAEDVFPIVHSQFGSSVVIPAVGVEPPGARKAFLEVIVVVPLRYGTVRDIRQ